MEKQANSDLNLAENFCKADEDRNGYLSMSEMIEAMRQAGFDGPEEKLQVLVSSKINTDDP